MFTCKRTSPNCPEAEDYDDTEDDMRGDGEEFFPGDRERAEERHLVEDELRHLALQAWVSMYRAQR